MDMARVYQKFGRILDAVGINGVPNPLTSPYSDDYNPFWDMKLHEIFDDHSDSRPKERLRLEAGNLLPKDEWIYSPVRSSDILEDFDLFGTDNPLIVFDLYEQWFAQCVMPKE